MGQPRQHNFIPVTGLNVKTLEALDERIRNDIELVLNSKACFRGTKWEVDLKSVDLYQQCFGLSLKLLTLVREKEKEKSPELQDSPDLLEHEAFSFAITMRKVESSGSYFALLLLLVVSPTGTTTAAGLFIFGDSTVDAGNNYIQTIPENRANFKPYAQNRFFHQPTGRFSDGPIIVDFIAEYANLPLIPPYLQPNADFSNGVNFASGGAGVIDLETQLKHFEEVRKTLTEKMEAAKAAELLLEHSIQMKKLLEVVSKLLLILPWLITMLSQLSSPAFNIYCKALNIATLNFYDWLLDRVNNPAKYGFKEGVKACCGAGPYGGINACGGTKKVTDYGLCDDAKEYIWFDSFHPTKGIHEQFAKALWDGPSSSVGPYTLQNLFFSKEKQTIGDIIDI
ncbi:hypothetical protein RND71_034486 [Anisodus tanguticus]|uniref:GDSL esterase/lipase 1-like n=1 Tax=Anisodus tanguticus TaxID=243964 RepID=A0AAE1RC94_9SOLA|nr:hypothetical protein RND71_034486 [Anisodus tanguticus]